MDGWHSLEKGGLYSVTSRCNEYAISIWYISPTAATAVVAMIALYAKEKVTTLRYRLSMQGGYSLS